MLRAAVAATERAAQATAGRVLLRDGAAASVYYAASCGGPTQLPSDVWPGAEDPPYLPSRDDDACGGAPAWTAELHESDLQRALKASGFRGELRDVKIAARNASGRVARLTLDGLKPNQISGQDLRVAVGRTLGWQHVKDGVRFAQKGRVMRLPVRLGHGVGLCVIGSARLAGRGESVEKFSRYFPGLAISAPADATLTGVRPGSDPVPTDPGLTLCRPGSDQGLTLWRPRRRCWFLCRMMMRGRLPLFRRRR